MVCCCFVFVLFDLGGFLGSGLVLPRVKVENFLSVYLGVRRVSQVTVPAEFPGGGEMGALIDERVRPGLVKVQSITEPRGKLAAIEALKRVMDHAFSEVVEGSEAYLAHYDWAERLGLRTNQVQIRPTVHELYLFMENSAKRELGKLLKERNKLRRKARRKPDPSRGGIQFAYPEEFNARWLKRMGRLLGYPGCCVDQYARDRVEGVNVEVRASEQLVEAEKRGEVDPYAYFTGFFFPCMPDCEAALEAGRRWSVGLGEFDPRLGELYGELVKVNHDQVVLQPEIIKRYLVQFRGEPRG